MDIALAMTFVCISIISLMIGINCFFRSEKNLKYTWYLSIMYFSSCIWSFYSAIIILVKDFAIAAFLRCIMFVGILVTLNMAVRLMLIWINVRTKFTTAFVTYLTLGSLILYPFIINQQNVTFVYTAYGTSYCFEPTVIRFFYTAFVLCIFLGCMIILVLRSYKTHTKRERVMARTIFISTLIMGVGMLPDTLLPVFRIIVFPTTPITQFIATLIVFVMAEYHSVNRITIRNVSEYIYSAVNTPIIITDEVGKIEIVNTSGTQFFGILQEQLVGTNFNDLFIYTSQEEADCLLNQAHCSLNVNPIYDRYHELIGNIIVVTDLTAKIMTIEELNQSKAEAIKATEAKSAFLANMSHEIRTPMNAIIGMSEILLKRELPIEIEKDLISIHNASEGLLAIINDILDYSKIESGKFQMTETTYQIEALVNDVVNMIAVRLIDCPVRFLVTIDPDMPKAFYGDDLRIKQILINLLGNAVKFTKEGQIRLEITIKDAKSGVGDLQIKVSDTGIGIKKEDIVTLFDKFNQVDTVKNRAISGTGLGLAISKNLIELMHGTIQVNSVYGEGTTFTCNVPQKIMDAGHVFELPKIKLPILVFEQNKVLIDYYTTIFKQLDIKSFVLSNEEDLMEYDYKNSYLLIRKHYFMKYASLLERKIKSNKVIIMLTMGESMDNYYTDYLHIFLPLFQFQICNLLNNRVKSNNIKKEVYDRNQVMPLPDTHILIVDDNRTNILVAEGMLAPYRMHVTSVTSGQEAIDKVKNNHYDLIFMDHMMPDMDGVETMQAIRSIDSGQFKNVPIIALTANAIDNARDKFIELGFQEFLAKPIEFNELNRILRMFLSPGVTEGIDWVNALKAMNGNDEMYERVLKAFLDDICKRKKEIDEILKQGNMKLFTIYVHAIKSAAKSVGAVELSDMSALLEKYGKDNDIDQIYQNLPSFYQMSNQVIQQIQGYLGNKRVLKKRVKKGEKLSDDIIKEIKAAADSMDYPAFEHILELLKSNIYDAQTTVLLDNLQEAIQDFDYTRLEKIASEL